MIWQPDPLKTQADGRTRQPRLKPIAFITSGQIFRRPPGIVLERRYPMLNAGDLAPDFTLLTHEGQPLSLSSLRGHKVLLWFYPKADTPGCTAEGCSLRDQYSYYEENHIVVLGVSFDNVEDNAAFVKKFNFPFTLLCDTE